MRNQLFVVVWLVVGHMCLAATTRGQSSGAGDSAAEVAPAAASPIPKVVSVTPADGDTDVATETVVSIRFNQPMRPGGISLVWEGYARESGFRLRGPVSYDDQQFEFSLPVCLRAGVRHDVSVNPGKRDRKFQSVLGIAAEPFQWGFTTDGPGNPPNGPQVVAVNPKPDTEVALITMLHVRFDRAMNPDCFGFSTDADRPRNEPDVVGRVTYDPDRHEFEIPMSLPPNWNGVLNLNSFRGVDGQAAQEKDIPYRTLRTLISESTQDRITKARQSDQLIQLLQRVRDSYSKIESVQVTASRTSERSSSGWSYHVEQDQAHFSKHGKKYFGDVSQIMNVSTFHVGCDGGECWFRYGDDVTVASMAEVAQQNVAIADGFSALTSADPPTIIDRYQLEHVGIDVIGNRRYHVLRSWAQLRSWWKRTQRVTGFQEWLVDDESALVFQSVGSGSSRTHFVYESVNQEIPADVFAVPDGDGLTRKDPAPLGNGYEHRFLNVSDGTNGRMSLRWGMFGTKGRSSSGLN